MKKIIGLAFFAFLTFRCVAQTPILGSVYPETPLALDTNTHPYFDTSIVVMLCSDTAFDEIRHTYFSDVFKVRGYEVSTFDMKGRIHVSYLDPEKKPVKWFVWLSKPIP